MEEILVVNWAHAAGQASAQESPMWSFVLPMVLMVAIFYFLLIRPQQRKGKEHRALLDNLKRGDRVLTAGGLVGEITSMTEQMVTLEVADKVRVEVARPYITGFAPKKTG
ncbi:MAG: preprotein translocase subunit YajC [Deltaproteobacteria bacterium]|nr:preprotein translocase subunit YajC [Deltaproteobacteria bacterium]